MSGVSSIVGETHKAREIAEVVESAMSRVGRIVGETRQAREITEATIAKVRSMQGEVQSQVASLPAHADANTAHMFEVLTCSALDSCNGISLCIG